MVLLASGGMGQALIMADQKNAYTPSDKATLRRFGWQKRWSTSIRVRSPNRVLPGTCSSTLAIAAPSFSCSIGGYRGSCLIYFFDFFGMPFRDTKKKKIDLKYSQ